MKILGVKFAPVQIPLSRRLETAAVLYYSTSFLFVGVGSIILCIYLLFTKYYFLPFLYTVWFVYDHQICNQGGRYSEWVRRWTLWNYFRDYFPVKLVKCSELDPRKNYIFGYHPHGIMCAGAFCNFATESTDFSSMFPAIKPHLLTLEGQFWFPFNREFFLSTGACAATKDGIEWLLTKKGTGNALVLVIGGAAEALDAHPGSVSLTLRRRRGFIKLAMKHGASLVPVFSFGENDLFEQVRNPVGSIIRNVQNYLTRIFRFSPPLFHGRGVFQYNIGYLPFRRPVTTVVGRPIDIEVVPEPTEKDILEVQQRYIDGLLQLFEEYKHVYGNKDLKLKID